MQEEYYAKGKAVVYVFCGPRESFYQSTVEGVGMGNEEENNTKKCLVRSVMSLYEGAKSRVRVDSELSEELVVKVRMCLESVLSPFLFAMVVDVVTGFAREGTLSELLYADVYVQISEMRYSGISS